MLHNRPALPLRSTGSQPVPLCPLRRNPAQATSLCYTTLPRCDSVAQAHSLCPCDLGSASLCAANPTQLTACAPFFRTPVHRLQACAATTRHIPPQNPPAASTPAPPRLPPLPLPRPLPPPVAQACSLCMCPFELPFRSTGFSACALPLQRKTAQATSLCYNGRSTTANPPVV